MARPGTIYAFDDEGPLYWPAVRPPPRWKWCPRRLGSKHEAVAPHFKPDDGARCLYCGSHDLPKED